MPSLHKKYTNGHPYWYIVESRRVGGKPRPVPIEYLGKAEDLLRRLRDPNRKPFKAAESQFGAVAALLDLANELRLVETVDRHVSKKRDQGLSVGQYILLAAINRCLAPCSKAQMAEWYETTSLKRLLPVPRKALASQRFWDHMRYLHKENLSRIEEELTQRLVEHLRVDLRTLLYDATNFDTFIDSTNPAELPQRGNAKSKRTDLRLVSLALMVSADFGIPLFSHLYPGNQADSVTFSQLVGPLAERCRKFAKETKDITIVFDKGNNSADNIGELANTPYHFIGALVASQHQDLLDIPLHQFSPAGHPRLEGVLAYRTRKKVYGNEYTIVIARSPGLLHGQLRGIDQHLKKKLRRVRCLQCKLRRSQKPGARGKGYSLTSLQKQCEEIQKGQYISEFLKLSPQEEEGRLFLHYHIDRQALERLTERQLGKTLIFTDNHDWTTPDIILGYRGQYRIEKAFRQMKDHHCLTFSPMHHWTDPMIRVHAFYCVVGYTLSALLQRRLAHAGIHLSIRQAMKFLSRIKEILLLYPVTDAKTGKRGKGRPRVEHVLSSLNRTQTALYKTLGLAKHFP